MSTVIDSYFTLLYHLFEYDIHIFSQPWMYYIALLPAAGYLVFFFIKWTVLTTPLWLPFSIIFNSLRRGGEWQGSSKE